ncbi:MAG: hypothetical protein ACE3JP_03350 [Ectobacillus sp.]
MDANKIIDYLLEKIKVLIRENAFLVAKLDSMEEEMRNAVQAHSNDGTEPQEGAVENA